MIQYTYQQYTDYCDGRNLKAHNLLSEHALYSAYKYSVHMTRLKKDYPNHAWAEDMYHRLNEKRISQMLLAKDFADLMGADSLYDEWLRKELELPERIFNLELAKEQYQKDQVEKVQKLKTTVMDIRRLGVGEYNRRQNF